MREIFTSNIFLITLTVLAYYLSKLLYNKFKLALLSPVLVSVIIVVPILLLLDIPFETYYQANEIINFGLKLSVVTLGYLLYQNVQQIKGKEFSILFSVFVGSIVGVVSVILLARAMGMNQVIIASLQPKSVTMPIALALCENSGGQPALTTMAVIVVGICGSLIGPPVLRACKVTDPVAKGLGMGSGSHAVGTARAMEMGAVEGAVSGAAIGLMGMMTALVLPIIERLFN